MSFLQLDHLGIVNVMMRVALAWVWKFLLTCHSFYTVPLHEVFQLHISVMRGICGVVVAE